MTDWRSAKTAYHNGRKVQVDLAAAVKFWPTPMACDGNKRGNVSNHPMNGLSAAVLWSTPTANDARNSTLPESQISRGSLVGDMLRMLPTPTTPRPHDNEDTAGTYMPSQKQQDLAAVVAREGGQLNPDWVCWAYGFPAGMGEVGLKNWWKVEPDIPRVTPRPSREDRKMNPERSRSRVDQLKAYGNAVVPMQYFPIFRGDRDHGRERMPMPFEMTLDEVRRHYERIGKPLPDLLQATAPPEKKRRKYGNQPTVVDGRTFDSRHEAERYQELMLMLKAGEILGVECQHPFRLPGKHRIHRRFRGAG